MAAHRKASSDKKPTVYFLLDMMATHVKNCPTCRTMEKAGLVEEGCPLATRIGWQLATVFTAHSASIRKIRAEGEKVSALCPAPSAHGEIFMRGLVSGEIDVVNPALF